MSAGRWIHAPERAREAERLAVASDNEPWIQTFTKRKFFPLHPHIEDIDIEDIAHALANQCRFTGHTSDFYSVAQHSVLVSQCAPEGHELHGLLHDGSEAYLIDVPRPLKRAPQFRGYREAEARLQRMIYQRFGLFPDEPADVKAADLAVFATEARDLMMPWHPDWSVGDLQPLAIIIDPLPPREAKALFLERFADLGGVR